MEKRNSAKENKECAQLSKVSVIIPVYNVKEYLRRCLDSVIAQTYTNLEIIIVDDGSTDGSQEICDEYTIDSRVRVIHKKNGGLSDARNTGLDVAMGGYITFIDSDDYIQKKMIEKLVYGCEKYKSEIAVCRYAVTEPDYWNDDSKKKECFSVITSEETIRLMLLQKKITHVSHCKLYKSHLFAFIRFPVGKLYEDYATTYKIVGSIKQVTLVDEPLYLYFQRKNSIQSNMFSERNFDELKYALECKQYIDEHFSDLHTEAICRLVSTCFHILFKMYDQKQYYPLIEEVVLLIKQYRMKCILSWKVSKKVKIGCALSYLGLPLEYRIFSVLGMRGKLSDDKGLFVIEH